MSLSTELKFPTILDEVRLILEDTPGVYLVGGAVRDTLLKQSSHDLDFVVEAGALRTARRVADALGGAYYTMDEEFQVGRIVLDRADTPAVILDFAAMQGDVLEDDLKYRDFTINAMAVDLQHPTVLIDPLGGAADMFRKQLRACSPTALIDDPVRALRAVRMSAAFGMGIVPETREQIGPAVGLLGNVSVERQRDEFFKVLDAPKPATSLRVLDHYGIIDCLIPEMKALKGAAQSPPHIYDVWEHSLQTVQKLDEMLSVLDTRYSHDNEMGGDVFTGLLAFYVGRYRQQISEHLQEKLNPGRSHRALLLLAAFCHDLTKPRHSYVDDTGRIRFTGHEVSGAEAIQARAEALRLSRAETRWLGLVMQHHARPLHFSWHDQPMTKKAVYRFWRDTEEAGVDVCLLATADALAIYGHTMGKDFYQRHLEVVRVLLDAYWEKPGNILPLPLLDGNDLIRQFSLAPGPKIGALLEALREAQAVGEVSSEGEALEFISSQLTEM